MTQIRKGDEVIVITGKNRKARGVVLQRVSADYVLVEGVNIAKKHVKPNPMRNEAGGIVERAMPIHVSNIALYNPATGKADRVGVKVEDGKKVRIFRSNGAVVGAKA